ncbi:hypothetical protein O3W44_23695 [Pantoea sp. LMR881]|nr:hypothetical protein [Pantoea sp. LMR881]MCZ4061499.1 hypothetical protein [Pantoea sp. LMR881]
MEENNVTIADAAGERRPDYYAVFFSRSDGGRFKVCTTLAEHRLMSRLL